MNRRKVRIFTGGKNIKLARRVCDELEMPLSRVEHQGLFNDGDEQIEIGECVRGCHCIVFQTTVKPESIAWTEFKLICKALKDAKAESIIGIISNFGGARQDRRDDKRVPVTAKVIAQELDILGINRLVIMDIHADAIENYFSNVGIEKISSKPLYTARFKILQEEGKRVFAGPDLSAAKTLAVPMSKEIQPSSVATVAKMRLTGETTEILWTLGDVEDALVDILDDILASGGTASGAADKFHEGKARDIRLNVPHAMLVGEFVAKLRNPNITKIRVTNSTPFTFGIPDDVLNKMEVLDVAPLFAEAIKVILENDPAYSIHRILTPGYWLEHVRRNKLVLPREDWPIETEDEKKCLDLMIKIAAAREKEIRRHIQETSSYRAKS